MTDRDSIEKQIRDVLATETHAIPLAEKLFSQENGLFGKLGATEAERRVIAQSSLFKDAQKRFRELQYKEAEVFARSTSYAQAAVPPGEHRFKLER